MNLNIFKTVFCLLFIATACKPKIFINENYTLGDVWNIEHHILPKYFYTKKTGIYIYPKLGTTIHLKKGKYNGEMSIIEKKDTLFYCVYQNNKPVGKYINVIPNEGRRRYYDRILPVKPKIDVGFGRGIFNQEHQKDGFWLDNNGSGNYINGLKNGEWIDIYCSDVVNEFDNRNCKKIKTTYKNDTIVSSVIEEF